MKKKVLTVDDSRTMREMVSFTLRGAGFDVVEANDGQQALVVQAQPLQERHHGGRHVEALER